MDPNCPHCGSKYVTFKGTDESFEKTSKNYYCQSCKKSFTVDTGKNSAKGTWLMTVSGDKLYNEYRKSAEIYLSDTGITINQKADGKYLTRKVSPKFKVNHNQYTNRYYLWLDTFTYFNDSDGVYITADKVELNPELTEKALKNEAMKIVHVKGNEFACGKGHNETVLIRDVNDWLNNALWSAAGTAAAASGSSSSSGGCYVATAVYGSYDCPQVWTLRRFRDQKLAPTWYGRAFIRAYYAISPTLVKWFGNTGWFRRFWRGKLDRMVAKLQAEGMEDTPYHDLY